MPRSAHTLRQIRFPDAQQIDALAAGDLHHRHVILVGDVGDAAELVGRRDAAADPRNDRERTVLLNVGVNAIVDEPCRAIFVVITAPDHVEHVAERGLADFTAVPVAVDVQDVLHRLEPLAAENLAKVVLRIGDAAAQDLSGLLFELRRDGLEQRLAQLRAAAAARAGARRLFQLRQRVHAAFMNGLDDGALADADAAADGRAVGHFRDVEPAIRGRRRKQKVPAAFREVGAGTQPVHVAMAVRRITDENRAHQLAVADRQFLVDAHRPVLKQHRLGLLLAPVARREHVDAHDLQLGRLHRAGVGGPLFPVIVAASTLPCSSSGATSP